MNPELLEKQRRKFRKLKLEDLYRQYETANEVKEVEFVIIRINEKEFYTTGVRLTHENVIILNPNVIQYETES